MTVYNIPTHQFITNTCILLGAIQGTLWSVMSFTVIILHFTAKQDVMGDFKSETYSQMLEKHLYFFFVGDRGRMGGLFIQPRELFVFMLLFFIFNLLWTLSSVYLCVASFKKEYVEKLKYHKEFCFSWPVTAACVALIDLIFFCLLCHDYNLSVEGYGTIHEINPQRLSSLYSIICFGIMMTISIRAFVLWIINVILIYYMTQICIIYLKAPEVTSGPPNIYGSTSSWSVGYQIPEDSINAHVNEPSVRRYTSGMQPDGKGIRVYNNVKYTYDPEIEEKLRTYTIVPKSGAGPGLE